MNKKKFSIYAIFLFILINVIIVKMWSGEPNIISEKELKKESDVAGISSINSLIYISKSIIQKRGGYLSNDIFPISYLMDDMPSFEFGVIEQIRDFTLILRREFSRNQSQSSENNYLKQAQPKLNIDHKSFMLPSTEQEYTDAIKLIEKYRKDLLSRKANFYPRADNLAQWLQLIKNKLGHLSQRLSNSIDQQGDARNKSKWIHIDNIFYEARGSCWALINLLLGIERDFQEVLSKKNIKNFGNIINELSKTQEKIWSPIIMNGSGFGLAANHSLIMANYISRANATIIDLIHLLEQG